MSRQYINFKDSKNAGQYWPQNIFLNLGVRDISQSKAILPQLSFGVIDNCSYQLDNLFAAWWRPGTGKTKDLFCNWRKGFRDQKSNRILGTRSKTNKTTEAGMRSKGLNRSTRWDKNRRLDSSHISAKQFLAGSGGRLPAFAQWSRCHSCRFRARANGEWRSKVWEAGRRRGCAMWCDIVVGRQMYNPFNSSKSCRHLSKRHLPHGASSYLADG